MPSSWQYWRREPLVYQSGLLENLPGSLTTPRCYGINEHEGETWLWLEDVRDDIGSQWPLERYGLVARHFGQWNGSYLAGESLPSWPWIGTDWLRSYVNAIDPAINWLFSVQTHPVIRRFLPDDDADTFAVLWRTRQVYHEALDRLPQTLCHRDVFSRNLFARQRNRGHDETVAIDWAYLSVGAIGEEIVPLVLATLMYGDVPLSEGRELEHIVYESYLDGLRDVGWQGDPQLVRLGFTTGAIRYLFAGMGLILRMLLGYDQHTESEQDTRRERIAKRFCDHRKTTLSMLAEARDLMDSL